MGKPFGQRAVWTEACGLGSGERMAGARGPLCEGPLCASDAAPTSLCKWETSEKTARPHPGVIWDFICEELTHLLNAYKPTHTEEWMHIPICTIG